MKFRCSQKELFDAFAQASSIIGGKGARPGPQELLLEVGKKGKITVSATDLEVSLRKTWSSEQTQVEESGDVTIPAARAVSILREIPDDTVELATEEGSVVICSNKSRFKVMASPVEEFPPLPGFPKEGGVTLSAELFTRMVRRTAFATATERVHYSLNGVFFAIEKGSVKMVGTDGRRLAVMSKKVKGLKGDDLKGIVPNKGIRLFERLCGELEKTAKTGDEESPEEKTVELFLVKNQLFFRADGVEASTLLIEGTYPDYNRVIPKGNDRELEVAQSDFLAGLRQASILAGDESKAVRFKIEQDKLVILAEAVGAGEAKVEVPAMYGYDALELQFNPTFFIDFARLTDEERIKILLKDGETAAVIKIGTEYTYVVMPLVTR